MWKEGTIIVGLLMCSILVLRRRRARGTERFPPGPPAWPIIGHLHLFCSDLPHRVLGEVGSKYGHILGLRLGQQRAVVVSSPELAKEVLLTHDKLFSGRPPFVFSSLLLYGGSTGIIFNQYGPQWRKHRKICILNLFTAKRLLQLQSLRQQELHHLLLSIHRLSRSGTTPIDLGRCVGDMSARLMMRLLRSKPSAQVGDENLQLLVRDQERQMTPTLGDFFPFLSCLDFFRKRRMRRVHARLDGVYTKMVMEGKESNSDDLLHALLSQQDSLTMVDIKSILLEMIGGGIHTTALTLEWVMAELLRNPDCLHRLQKEIDREVGGKEQAITDANIPNLRYLNSVIKEASRLHPIVPLLTPRMSTEECKVQGYTIPAKTLMFVNVWAIGRDERVWPNANKFIPERFEGKDIDLKGQHFELLPFGSGRRSCVAIPLALSVVHVTIANLVRCFDWELPNRETHRSINMDENFGFNLNRATPVIVIPKPRVSLSKLTTI